MPFLILYPLTTVTLLFILLIYFMVVAGYIASAGSIDQNSLTGALGSVGITTNSSLHGLAVKEFEQVRSCNLLHFEKELL